MGDCVMSEWGSWSKCTRSCGVGIQSRLRQELTSAKYGGKPCGLLSQHQLCGMRNCPVDCEVTPWGTWGACNKKCIDRSVPNVVLGKRKRVRMIMTTTSDGGKQCPSLLETAPCDPGPCQIHCDVWQRCSQARLVHHPALAVRWLRMPEAEGRDGVRAEKVPGGLQGLELELLGHVHQWRFE